MRIESMSDLWLLAQQAEPLIKRLDPPTRAKVLAALAALVILGFSLMLLAWLGARATRRYMASSSKRSPTPLREDDWAHKPLHDE